MCTEYILNCTLLLPSEISLNSQGSTSHFKPVAISKLYEWTPISPRCKMCDSYAMIMN